MKKKIEYRPILHFFIYRSKGGQISPQETEVTQFVRSDMDSVTGQNTANTATTALEGRQGMPAGKLPPLGDTVSLADVNTCRAPPTHLQTFS